MSEGVVRRIEVPSIALDELDADRYARYRDYPLVIVTHPPLTAADSNPLELIAAGAELQDEIADRLGIHDPHLGRIKFKSPGTVWHSHADNPHTPDVQSIYSTLIKSTTVFAAHALQPSGSDLAPEAEDFYGTAKELLSGAEALQKAGKIGHVAIATSSPEASLLWRESAARDTWHAAVGEEGRLSIVGLYNALPLPSH